MKKDFWRELEEKTSGISPEDCDFGEFCRFVEDSFMRKCENVPRIALPQDSSFLEDLNTAENRELYVYLVYDLSGGMSPYSHIMYESFMKICRCLANFTNEREDCKYLVKLVFFNENVVEYNHNFLDPQELMTICDESNFSCSGLSTISNVLGYLEKQFWGQLYKVRQLNAHDPKHTVVIFSEFDVFRGHSITKNIAEQIISNSIYSSSKLIKLINRTICVCSDDEGKKIAVDFFKEPENVFSSVNDEFLNELLTPILISNNIIISDDGELKIEPYGWELPDPSDLSDEEAAKALRELLGF